MKISDCRLPYLLERRQMFGIFALDRCVCKDGELEMSQQNECVQWLQFEQIFWNSRENLIRKMIFFVLFSTVCYRL